MSLFRRTPSQAESNPNATHPAEEAGSGESHEEQQGVAGERGLPPQNPFKSVQSRVSSTLTVALMIALAAGLLIWYYSTALGRGDKARSAALAAEQRRAQGDTNLPPLGPFHLPRSPDRGSVPTHDTEGRYTNAREAITPSSPLERILGAPPEPPTAPSAIPSSATDPYTTAPYSGGTPPKTPAQLALDRRLAGPVLMQAPGGSTPAFAGSAGAGGVPFANFSPPGSPSTPEGRPESESRGVPTLETLLHATPTPVVDARVLPTQRYLLPEGAFIDCTLETAISSSLPGMTTCVTATDTFSADGTVVLLERGTKLVGETRGMVQAGSPRLFVLWNQARTPAGIVVPLASPGTDELGRSGLSGSIDWHWWQRFGAAILVTVIDGVVQTVGDRSSSSSIQINPSGASEVMTDILRGTLSIPPTINKPQGDRIEILVARDVDFRTVYTLRAAQTLGGSDGR
jgi:type IV secretion system protein VirB10